MICSSQPTEMVIAPRLRCFVYVYNDLCAVDGKKCVLLSLLDLSSTFNIINHTVLLQRFEHTMGINGSAFEWLKSYFSGREQFVHVEGASSSWLLVQAYTDYWYASWICDWSIQIPRLPDIPGEDLLCSWS